MAVRYRINLIREELARQSARRRALQPVVFCLLALDLMLLATLGIYLARDESRRRDAALTKNYLQNMREINPDEVESLRKENVRLAAMVAYVAKVVEGSTSWSSALSSLAQCGGTSQLCFTKVWSKPDGGTVLVVVEGICSAENPMATLQEFLRALAQQHSFEPGRVDNLGKRNEDEAFNFTVSVPLKSPKLMPLLASPKTATPEKPAVGEKSA